MRKNYFLKIIPLFVCILFSFENLNAITNNPGNHSLEEKNIYFTIRLGQGGFIDNRSPIGKLGGGQLTLDIKPAGIPIGISVSGEYYTNSADPSHTYEIAGLTSFNLLYTSKLFKTERTHLFIGSGIGMLEVPKGNAHPDEMENGTLYNIECGINFKAFWKIGFYGIIKYLYASKKKDNIKVIDFNEFIVLLGITLNFGY